MEMFWWRVKSKAVYNLSLNIHDQAGIASKMKKGGGEEYSKYLSNFMRNSLPILSFQPAPTFSQFLF